MPISDWADLMKERVTIAPFVSRDSYGVPTYGSGVSYKCRIGHSSKWVRKSDGSIVVASAAVWIEGSPEITPQAKLTLPNGSTPPIISVDRFFDDRGAHHVKIYLG